MTQSTTRTRTKRRTKSATGGKNGSNISCFGDLSERDQQFLEKFALQAPGVAERNIKDAEVCFAEVAAQRLSNSPPPHFIGLAILTELNGEPRYIEAWRNEKSEEDAYPHAQLAKILNTLQTDVRGRVCASIQVTQVEGVKKSRKAKEKGCVLVVLPQSSTAR